LEVALLCHSTQHNLHFRQAGINSSINAAHRLDIDLLKKLVPFITFDQFKQRCSGKEVAILRLKEMDQRTYSRLEEKLQMKLPIGKSLHELPYNLKPNSDSFFVFNASRSSIVAFYASEVSV